MRKISAGAGRRHDLRNHRSRELLRLVDVHRSQTPPSSKILSDPTIGASSSCCEKDGLHFNLS